MPLIKDAPYHQQGKYRPKMAHAPMPEDHEGPFGPFYLDDDDAYFQAEGKYPVFLMRHHKIALAQHEPHRLPHQFLNNTTYITELPQGFNPKGGHQADPAHHEMMRYATSRAGKHNKMVCADGKRAYDGLGKLHHMRQASSKSVHHEAVTAERITSLASRYLDHVLLKGSNLVSQYISEMVEITGNSPEASPRLVVQTTTNRVVQLVGRLERQQKAAIKAAVLHTLEEDLQRAHGRYTHGLKKLQQHEARHRQNVQAAVAAIKPKKALLPPAAYQALVDEINAEAEAKITKAKQGKQAKYALMLQHALTDVFGHVLLLAEVAGTEAELVVVANAAARQRPLRHMLKKLRQIEIEAI